MKKLLALLVLALFAAGAVSAADSPMYAKVTPIHKVAQHQKGMIVTYYLNTGALKTIYLPIEWFYQTAGYKTPDGFLKVEVVKGKGPSYPYMQVFWKDGKFHHLRLFLVDYPSDPTWGVVDPSKNLDAQFDPAKPLELVF